MKLEVVRVRDQQIEAIRDARNGEYGIPFRPTCERMGLGADSQLKRLKRHHWATTVIMTSVADDGKVREMVTVNRKTFVMWLATIDASRIKDQSVRATVELYQAEAVEALDRHFFGDRTASVPALSESRLAAIETDHSFAMERIYELVETCHDLASDLDQAKRLLALTHAKASYAEQAVTGTSGFRTLSSWAKQRGIHLTPRQSRAEAEICASMSATARVPVGSCPRADGRAVPIFSTHVLELWLVGYLRRQDERPSLFSA